MPFSEMDVGVYDPETISLLKSVLDDAWSQLSPAEQARTLKSELAVRVLRAAAHGERDPMRLRAFAVLRAVDS